MCSRYRFKRVYLQSLVVAALASLLGEASFASRDQRLSKEESPMKTVLFHGIRPTDPGGRNGLRNPERGLRLETLIAEPPGQPAWGPVAHLQGKVSPVYTDQWWIMDARRYEPFGLTLAQTYCYLDPYVDRAIPAKKLQWLQKSLGMLRSQGLKAVLRFAYERDMDRRKGPKLEAIIKHLDQLAPIIRRNADVIFVMQAGMVGAWGEWHSSKHQLESDHAALAAIVDKVLEVLPSDRMTQLRVPKYKRWVLDRPVFGGYREVDGSTAHTTIPTARIGFNNDGFLAGPTDGGTWTESPRFGSPGNPEFDQMTRESAFVPVDGELFWSDQGGRVDGLAAAVRMRLHHYSSFSLAHSYSEREGKPYAIDEWMKAPAARQQVMEASLPLSDGYFEDADGRETSRTWFEYIRDHLGYRLELRRAAFPEAVHAGETVPVQIELINRGFSVPHNPRPVYLTLTDSDGKVVSCLCENVDLRRWQPFQPGDIRFAPLTHTIETRLAVPDAMKPGWYQVGLWMPDAAPSLRENARYAIRAANRDAYWWTDAIGRYGINILGLLEVKTGR
ncbi:MAG: DUF4832 domain-containing protein [Armatimonadetes bacterium]|nr:DUF4832 domain-containing protein [Armatimonadota bacterium]